MNLRAASQALLQSDAAGKLLNMLHTTGRGVSEGAKGVFNWVVQVDRETGRPSMLKDVSPGNPASPIADPASAAGAVLGAAGDALDVAPSVPFLIMPSILFDPQYSPLFWHPPYVMD